MKRLIAKYQHYQKTPFARDTLVRLLFSTELFFVAAGVFVLIFFWRAVDQPVPISYTSFVQAAETGPWYMIYQFPVFGLFVTGINGLLAYLSYSKDKLISYLFMGFGAFVNLLFLINVINFIFLVD